MMHMFFEYLKEQEASECFSVEHGFIVYHIKDSECFLRYAFVTKEHRGGDVLADMFEDFLLEQKENGIKRVTFFLQACEENSGSLSVYLRKGAKLLSAKDNFVYLFWEV